MLDGLGLGPKGPPIPPPAVFSVVPFPVKRKAPANDPSGHYVFVASNPDDPNVVVEDIASKEGTVPEEPVLPEVVPARCVVLICCVSPIHHSITF